MVISSGLAKLGLGLEMSLEAYFCGPRSWSFRSLSWYFEYSNAVA